MNIGAEGEEDNNNKKKEKEAEAWRGRICSLNGSGPWKMMGISEGGERFFPVLARDTDTMGCFVLFIFMDLGQRVSTLTLWVGRGLRGEVKPERGW